MIEETITEWQRIKIASTREKIWHYQKTIVSM